MSSKPANPTATFANNLGYDVDIYDVFNLDANTQGPLTYTKLATVPNGATAQQLQTIHFASQLQAMRTGTITALNNNYYEQFPVAVLAVSLFAPSNTFTLTSDMQQGMEQSFKFIKYSQANPTSKLAKDFRTALGDKKSQKDAVNAFFQSTGSFKLCTLNTWTAIFSWQAQFTNPWQGTYYLYSLGKGSSSSGGGGADSTTGSSAPALVATLAIVASAQASLAVLTMAGTNNENTTIVMVGDGTMQEKDAGTGNLSVVLNPTWLNVSQTSKQDGQTVTNYVIGAGFTGTINGTRVAGNLNQLAIPDSSNSSANAKDKNSANGFTLSSFTQVMGMLISMGMLYYMAKGHKANEAQRKNNVQEEANNEENARQRENQVEENYQANDVPQLGARAQQLEIEVVEVVGGAYAQVNQAERVQVMQGNVARQIDQVEEVLQEGAPSRATENTAERLAQARSNLQKAMDPATSASDRNAAVEEATNTLNNTSTELNAELQKEGSELSQAEEKALSNTKEALNEVKERADAAEKAEKEREQQDEKDPDQEVDEKDLEDPVAEDPLPFAE